MDVLTMDLRVNKNLSGMLLPLVCLSLAGTICVGSLVLYQAFYACSAAQSYYRTCQQEYCLTGLLNQEADACMRFIKISGNFKDVRTYTVADWLDPQQPVTITIEPCEHGYKITVKRQQKIKTGTLFFAQAWRLKIDA